MADTLAANGGYVGGERHLPRSGGARDSRQAGATRRGRHGLLAIAVPGILLVSVVPVTAEPWPVSSLPIFARAAPGATKIGPFTSEPTKAVGLGEYVTWRFATDPPLAWADLTIELADEGANGAWSPFRRVTTVVLDDTGVAWYAMTSSTPRWVSIRSPMHHGL